MILEVFSNPSDSILFNSTLIVAFLGGEGGGKSLRSYGVLELNRQIFLAVASSTVQMLNVSEISTNGALVSWDSVAGATGYRVAWGPTPGKIPLSSSLNHPHLLL